jgi:hypothetical protein
MGASYENLKALFLFIFIYREIPGVYIIDQHRLKIIFISHLVSATSISK